MTVLLDHIVIANSIEQILSKPSKWLFCILILLSPFVLFDSSKEMFLLTFQEVVPQITNLYVPTTNQLLIINFISLISIILLRKFQIYRINQQYKKLW